VKSKAGSNNDAKPNAKKAKKGGAATASAKKQVAGR
jgi:hypothetical protein